MTAIRLIWSYLFGDASTYGDVLHARIDAYERWRDEQVCEGCGAAYKDRPRDENGTYTNWWMTEQVCMACWEKGTKPPEAPTEFDLRRVTLSVPPL